MKDEAATGLVFAFNDQRHELCVAQARAVHRRAVQRRIRRDARAGGDYAAKRRRLAQTGGNCGSQVENIPSGPAGSASRGGCRACKSTERQFPGEAMTMAFMSARMQVVPEAVASVPRETRFCYIDFF